jgi:hypothetical protein
VTPAWDAERAAHRCPRLRVTAADDVVDALEAACRSHGSRSGTVGLSGLAATRWDVAGRLAQMLPHARPADDIVFDAAAAKTTEEIAHAREGYGEYCHPPHIRRRGHGLGFGSIRPGDVSLDNDTVLTDGMVFMIHPNQHLPETGYLLCGEPVLLTARGAEPLTKQRSALFEIGI